MTKNIKGREVQEVRFSERVWIVGTGRDPRMPKMAEYSVHPLLAEKLVKSNKATFKGK